MRLAPSGRSDRAREPHLLEPPAPRDIGRRKDRKCLLRIGRRRLLTKIVGMKRRIVQRDAAFGLKRRIVIVDACRDFRRQARTITVLRFARGVNDAGGEARECRMYRTRTASRMLVWSFASRLPSTISSMPGRCMRETPSNKSHRRLVGKGIGMVAPRRISHGSLMPAAGPPAVRPANPDAVRRRTILRPCAASLPV